MKKDLKEILAELPHKLGKNATITIARCKNEDSIEIHLDDCEISTSEYSKQLDVDGIKYEMENPYQEIIKIVKANI